MTRVSDVVRWVVTPIAAVLGALVAQVVVFQLVGVLLYAAFGLPPGGSTIWAVKTVTSVFMGAAFVGVVWFVSPDRKLAATVVAFLVVLLWGGTLMIGAFERGFFGWLFAMGLAGVAGGAGALWLGRRAVGAMPIGAAQQ
jgi:hypothetical protein